MNEKLTREQRDEILGLICQAPKDNRPCDECETQYFCNILTANTAEDDCQHKNMSNTNTHNKSGILQSAKICNDCNVVIPDPTEDEDMCQCFTCQGSGKWASGFCPDSENPAHTAEDDFQREWQIERQEMARETRPNNKELA